MNVEEMTDRCRRTAKASVYGGWGAGELAWLDDVADQLEYTQELLEDFFTILEVVEYSDDMSRLISPNRFLSSREVDRAEMSMILGKLGEGWRSRK
jgi:hypothetical protein